MILGVTGITGTLGGEILRLASEDAEIAKIIGFSRDEQKQRLLKGKKLKCILGDIRDEDAVLGFVSQCDVIIHAAALKCVDTLEANAMEAIKTNILGTSNLVKASRSLGKHIIMASTDKAVYPINIYGVSKKAAEKLVIDAGGGVVRYGNVLGSRGSVLSEFVKTLKTASSVRFTDKNMTRFWITIERAASFIYEAAKKRASGLGVPSMKAASIVRIAESVSRVIGVPIRERLDIGIRPGEKIHECLESEEESPIGKARYSNTVEQYNDDELDELVSSVLL